MENKKIISKKNIIMFFYLCLFDHLLINVSNTNNIANSNKTEENICKASIENYFDQNKLKTYSACNSKQYQ